MKIIKTISIAIMMFAISVGLTLSVQAGEVLFSSNDGKTWASTKQNFKTLSMSVDGRYGIGVKADGSTMYSPNGIKWIPINSLILENALQNKKFKQVVIGKKRKLFALATDDALWVSDDFGIIWTTNARSITPNGCG